MREIGKRPSACKTPLRQKVKTMKNIVIRENIEQHMAELKAWLKETENNRLEEMADFFRVRLDGYEEHMMVWKDAYAYLAEIFPAKFFPAGKENAEGQQDGCFFQEKGMKVLDLGCGTGLELDELLKKYPDIEVTGVDLSKDMLAKLQEKHPQVKVVCGDYFKADLGEAVYDAVITFESLHHFKPEKKQGLFEKIYRALKPGGVFLEVDYLACCEEEETLLMEICDRKRREEGIPEDVFVHFDTPLTAEKEMDLIRNAGFEPVELIASIAGASFVKAVKDAKI